MLAELPKHPKALGPNTYGRSLINSPRDLGIIDTLKSLKPDQTEFNVQIPPWDSTLTTFKFTELPMAKHNCSPQLLQRVASRAIQESQEPGCTVYYTDGTVDPDTNTSGAAVYSEQYTACWRVSDGASTMQTELVAITQALLYSSTHGVGPVTIHTDAKSALQALQQATVAENKSLIMHLKLLLLLHKHQNRRVTLNWIPSHIGIPGNDNADDLAKTTKFIDRVQIIVQTSLQQVRNMLKEPTHRKMIQDVHHWAENNSYSARWYRMACNLETPPISKHTPRKLAVIIHKLRLG